MPTECPILLAFSNRWHFHGKSSTKSDCSHLEQLEQLEHFEVSKGTIMTMFVLAMSDFVIT